MDIAIAQSSPSVATLNLAHKDAAFTEFFRQTNSWSAGDGGISLPLSDGRVLWLFGDSYVDQFDVKTKTLPCLFSARNAVLVQDTNRPRHVERPDPRGADKLAYPS